ncbi:M35 family metallo-endopeptidase [Massilia glaciei]|uniref:M35 family metallo-endopeptidase n=1 Tax=Massilia glaciei TaxID=1524097 RepID=UPI001E428C98|nr:M35 family metallo-endopeptidase [Massilia glaciei]
MSVSIAAEKIKLNKNDDVVLKVTFTNTSATPQLVLKWHTPFAGVEESLFDVTRDGTAVPYLGAHYKRPAPKAGDYFLLKPGASHSTKVELSGLYDMSVTGDYAVRYRTSSFSMFTPNPRAHSAASTRAATEISSAPVSLWIDGRLPRGSAPDLSAAKRPGGGGGGTAGLSFTGCTSSQASTITSAVNAAKNMASGSSSYLGTGNAGARYTKWFGTYDASRYATVRSNFAAIGDAFATKPVVVDCSCNQSYYAYVYPTQPYKIYVCKAFWSAPLTGTDSKGGTMIHEMSHFNAVAGTDDVVYGQSGAASLAISNPSKAITNADSHEYFAENTPSLQ